jgi:lysophospholipase L1-like esterase
VDSLGRRRTIQAPPSGTAPFRVAMLGGSAMWGYTARDSATIPSLVAAKLAADGVTGVELVNLAQPGYVFGQELTTLRLEVEHGNAPSMAVFFDGINDVRTSLLYGEPGRVFFEPRFKQLYEVESKRGFVGSLVASSLRSAVLQRLLMRLGLSREWVEPPAPPMLCDRLGGYYRQTSLEAEGFAQRHGMQVLFVQQPMHGTTNKPLTPFEQGFMQLAERNTLIRRCGSAIDSAMVTPTALPYVSMAKLFDDHKETVFLDDFGHVTEAGNALIAERIASAIADAVKARSAALAR